MAEKLQGKNGSLKLSAQHAAPAFSKGGGGQLLSPVRSFFALYEEILESCTNWRGIASLVAGFAIGWWVYVPVHELMHVAGCVLSGGEVTELQIQPLYGGNLLGEIFPFVSGEGEYAGRLSGFATHGSDLVYAVTVYFPYLLSLPGFYFLYRATLAESTLMFAFFLPLTFAPLIGLTGDFYELGSILLYQLLAGPENLHRQLISDDLPLLIKNLFAERSIEEFGLTGIFFVIGSFCAGAALAWATTLLSTFLADWARKR